MRRKEKVENLTYFEHDMREIGKAFTNQLVGFGVVGVMHLYMKVNPPLLLQTVMMPMNLWDMPVFQVHALGKDATKTPALKRPWKPEEQPNPFADLAKALNPEADKPAAGDKPKVKGVKKVRKGPRRAN